jgi:nitrogen fixation protein NifU and related proteins
MYTPAMLDHLENPRNSGELPAPAVTAEVTNPACGDIMRLSIQIDGRQISEARFKTRGCVAAIAAGSLMTELVKGKTVEEAGRLTAADVSNGLGGLPPASAHAGTLAIDALRAVLKASGAANR